MNNRITNGAEDDLETSRLATIVLAVVLVVPYATGAVSYLFSIGRFPIQPRDYLLATALVAVVIGFFRPPKTVPGTLILLGLLGVRLTDAIVFHRVSMAEPYFIISQVGASLAFLIGMVCLGGDRETVRKFALLCAGLTIVINVAANAWEWQNPGAFSTVEGRSAGMLENANDSANSIAIMLAVALAVAPRLWIAAGLIMVSGVGVYFSLSRGGALVWLLVVLSYFVMVARDRLRHFIGLGIWLVVIGLVVIQIVNFESSQSQDKNVVTRQGELTGREAVDVNDTGRLDLLKEGITGIQGAPISGYGTGSSWGSPYLPHNELAAVWLDNGVLGIGLFLLALGLLVAECARRERRLLIGCIPLCAETVISHNLLEDKSYLFGWMVMAAMLQFARDARDTSEWEIRSSRRGRPKRAISNHPAAPFPEAAANGAEMVAKGLNP